MRRYNDHRPPTTNGGDNEERSRQPGRQSEKYRRPTPHQSDYYPRGVHPLAGSSIRLISSEET